MSAIIVKITVMMSLSGVGMKTGNSGELGQKKSRPSAKVLGLERAFPLVPSVT